MYIFMYPSLYTSTRTRIHVYVLTHTLTYTRTFEYKCTFLFVTSIIIIIISLFLIFLINSKFELSTFMARITSAMESFLPPMHSTWPLVNFKVEWPLRATSPSDITSVNLNPFCKHPLRIYAVPVSRIVNVLVNVLANMYTKCIYLRICYYVLYMFSSVTPENINEVYK